MLRNICSAASMVSPVRTNLVNTPTASFRSPITSSGISSGPSGTASGRTLNGISAVI